MGEQGLMNDDRLFTHNIFSAVFIKLRKFLIIVHTENTEDAEVRKRTLWGEQGLMNDDRLLITDGIHTENTDGYGGPQADDGGEQQLSKIGQQLKGNY